MDLTCNMKKDNCCNSSITVESKFIQCQSRNRCADFIVKFLCHYHNSNYFSCLIYRLCSFLSILLDITNLISLSPRSASRKFHLWYVCDISGLISFQVSEIGPESQTRGSHELKNCVSVIHQCLHVYTRHHTCTRAWCHCRFIPAGNWNMWISMIAVIRQ